jgi:ribosomal peptide maturation radical SAM protein 1
MKSVLISAPWANANMPSIQIGSLKAYLDAHGHDVLAFHWFVDVAKWMGFGVYEAICSPHVEDAECLYGYLLFPEKRESILKLESLRIKELTVKRGSQRLAVPSERFFAEFRQLHIDFLNRIPWKEVGLAGFTLNYGQNLASVFLAREIKRMAPHVRTIVGGAEASGELGQSLLDCFPELDFACNGEGELPLLELARRIESQQSTGLVQGITQRGVHGAQVSSPNQLKDLSVLPPPHYDDYFTQITNLGLNPHSICNCLPIESSRGCYYKCNFCALNMQWEGFRQFNSRSVGETVESLKNRYRLLDFFFVDNVTPTNVEQICELLCSHKVDYRLFYEARADLPRSRFASLKKAGVVKVQLGIEAFSTSLLRKFNKKTRCIYNLQGLKNCFELGIKVTANLITEYPFSTQQEIQESISTMRLARAYPPVDSISPFAMEVGAPDYENSLRRGIEITGNYRLYERAYPTELLQRISLARKSFNSGGEDLDWSPVHKEIESWNKIFCSVTESMGLRAAPLLCLDGGSFLRIEDRRFGGLRVYQLNAVQRQLYLALDQVVHLRNIDGKIPELTGGKLLHELRTLVEEGLVFTEDDLYLSLATREA